MAVTCKIPVIKLFTNEHNALPCGHVLLKSFNAKYLTLKFFNNTCPHGNALFSFVNNLITGILHVTAIIIKKL